MAKRCSLSLSFVSRCCVGFGNPRLAMRLPDVELRPSSVLFHPEYQLARKPVVDYQISDIGAVESAVVLYASQCILRML